MDTIRTKHSVAVHQSTHSTLSDPSAEATNRTKTLLTAGMVAGPLYIIVGALEMLLRTGYDIRRHPLSILANGDWGWIHILLMATTGLLTIAGAIGVRRALRKQRAGTWGPMLLTIFGLGVTCAAFFTLDPALGFPPGTPADARAISWHGMLHNLCGSIGFLGLISACLVFARRFISQGRRGLAAFSIVTGVCYLSACVTGLMLGASAQDPTILALITIAFTAGVALGYIWLATVLGQIKRSFNQ